MGISFEQKYQPPSRVERALLIIYSKIHKRSHQASHRINMARMIQNRQRWILYVLFLLVLFSFHWDPVFAAFTPPNPSPSRLWKAPPPVAAERTNNYKFAHQNYNQRRHELRKSVPQNLLTNLSQTKRRVKSIRFAGTSASGIADNKNKNTLDQVLSKLTSAFPLFVLVSAVLGLLWPSTLMWTNRGSLISWMLASIMCATGLTLEKKDFTQVLGRGFAAVPVGVLCQFIIMPLAAFLIGKPLFLGRDLFNSYGPSLFLGLCLVGCSPGGTASNLVALIAKADVALSVLLTSCSTIMAFLVTPLLVKFLVGNTIQISGLTLCEATARVVLLPVILGMLVNAKAPNLASKVSRFTPFASVLLVSLIAGGVVSQNASLLFASSAMVPLIIASVVLLHCTGFLVGYLVPRWGLGFSERTARTISIETGMQNSALAVVLARSIGAPPVASLPGALSGTAHSCLGSILAGYWHSRQQQEEDNDSGSDNNISPEKSKESPDDYPELLI